ncbi:N-6 DNA methylase [Bifidobacterium tissieri]|nr:N-6 DNA methylase [Bifidobacterium tissieri]
MPVRTSCETSFTDRVNGLFGVSESFELPTVLMRKLSDPAERERLFAGFLGFAGDLSYDLFIDYFQEGHADRAKLKQDYTPRELAALVASIVGESASYGDICAGSGSLTIAAWNRNPAAFFYCEEYSAHVLPLLLFNLAIRNMDALVVHGDSLTRECFKAYRLEPGERFSSIREMDGRPDVKVDCIVSNPPYSMKWTPVDDERFHGYGLPPASKSDYAFMLHAMSLLDDDGRAVFILPHGVLFRGQKEEGIRRTLVERGQLETIIGLPDKLFLNTGIPVCVIETAKTRRDHGDVLFIDASRDYAKESKRNRLRPEDASRILTAVQDRSDVPKYAHLATFDEIEENGFNLNIPRYVDTFEPEPLPDLAGLMRDIAGLNGRIHDTETGLADMVGQLTGFSMDELEALHAWKSTLVSKRRTSRNCSTSNAPKKVRNTQPALF